MYSSIVVVAVVVVDHVCDFSQGCYSKQEEISFKDMHLNVQ